MVKKSKDSNIHLPFNGLKKDDCCSGLKENWGLYTQCKNPPKEGKKYCKVCQNQADKNNGIPSYGTIEDRCKKDIFEFVDPNGKKPLAYTKIMKKFNYTREQVLEECARINIDLDERHFEEETEKESKRGRPKSTDKEEKVKGAKGRPKKDKKVMEITSNGDLFEQMVNEANEKEAENKEKKEETEEEVEEDYCDEEEEEEAPDVVKRITYEGKKYLKSKNTGIIYNEDQDVVGKWNDNENRIDFYSDEDEEEEDQIRKQRN